MAKKTKIQIPTGMHDILPEDQKYYKKIYDVCEEIADFYGFQKISTPILENAELFNKGTGATTDIVTKEMLSVKTKGRDSLTLRPEGTPSIIRAYIEHGMSNLPRPVKLWYFGPFFRYERPQAGRYRQFHQFGFEILGEEDSVFDAQIIQIFNNILKELKIKNVNIEVNNIGDEECKPQYRKVLKSFLKSKTVALCKNCKERAKENPLRVLDCKDEECQKLLEKAPQTIDNLCGACHDHFKNLLKFLDEVELPYNLNPKIVRGLDYYTRTVFEVFSKTEDENLRQSALGGGGRYDDLMEFLGGKSTPAVGMAGGVERIVKIMKDQDSLKFPKKKSPEVFLAQLGPIPKRKGLKLMEEFRIAKIPITESFGRDSLNLQLKIADKIGARYSLILGQREALEGSIILRDMKNGRQTSIKIDKVVEEVKKKLNGK